MICFLSLFGVVVVPSNSPKINYLLPCESWWVPWCAFFASFHILYTSVSPLMSPYPVLVPSFPSLSPLFLFPLPFHDTFRPCNRVKERNEWRRSQSLSVADGFKGHSKGYEFTFPLSSFPPLTSYPLLRHPSFHGNRWERLRGAKGRERQGGRDGRWEREEEEEEGSDESDPRKLSLYLHIYVLVQYW